MIIDENNFAYMMMCLEANDEIAVDTETSGLNVRNRLDYLMGFCFSVDGMACYVPFRHKSGNLPLHYLDHIVDILNRKDLIWHNAKFDYHSVKTIGINPLDFRGKQYDTMMLAQLVNEELYSKELNALAQRYLKKEKYKSDEVHKMGELFGYANLPVEVFKDYGPQDAVLTRELKPILWREIVRQGLESVYWDTEEPFLKLLYKLEQRGVGTNQDFAQENATLGRSRMATLTRGLRFNPASPIALGKYLLDELDMPILAHTDSCKDCKKGEPVGTHDWKASFNKNVMEEYDRILQVSNNPAARRIGEFRGWQKAVTSLYEPILEKTAPDGYIRTEFKQHGTVTGRLSASNPNLQQVPRGSSKPWNGHAKACFWSGRDGYSLYGWDYSQLELRLGAAYGQEELLLAEFAKEQSDVFSALAPRIFGYLDEETRHKTKNGFVYPSLYGAGLNKIVATLAPMPREDVERYYENYKDSIPGIISVSKQVDGLVKRRGWVKYWDGRRRHIRNPADSYKAWNSVLQGGGAQLVKKAMLRCQEFEDDNCFMVLQVHDEITFCVRTDLIPHYEPMIIKAMTDWPQFGVNLHVEGKEWK